MRRRTLTIASLVSLLMLVSALYVWHRAAANYIPERESIEARGREIFKGVHDAPWGSPEYRKSLAEYDAWREQVRDEYLQREPQVLATHHFRYVVMPLSFVCVLSIPTVVWVFFLWRDWERRWALRCIRPPTQSDRIFRSAFTALASGSLVLATATAAIWVRSYWVTDALFPSRFFDEGDFTFWRQTHLEFGRGSAGVSMTVQSGPAGSYKKGIDSMYQRSFGIGVDAIPVYFRHAPRDVDFQFGNEQRKWGFAWSHFESGRAGNRPRSYSYLLVVPLWSLQAVFLTVPTLWTWRTLKRRRLIRQGCCRKCGYNLTGNTSGICPECGTPLRANTPKTHVLADT